MTVETIVRIFCCYTTTIDVNGNIYIDQTGKFPHLSLVRNNYIIVIYDYDSKTITSKPLNSWSEDSLLQACTELYKNLHYGSLFSIMYVLDHEAPQVVDNLLR